MKRIDLKLRGNNILQWNRECTDIIVAINKEQALLVKLPTAYHSYLKMEVEDLNSFGDYAFNPHLIDFILPFETEIEDYLYQSSNTIVVRTTCGATITYSKEDNDIIVSTNIDARLEYINSSGRKYELGDYFVINFKLYQAIEDADGFMFLRTVGDPQQKDLIRYQTSMAELVEVLYSKSRQIIHKPKSIFSFELIR